MDRRQHDPRIAILVTDVATLKMQMEENTKVTVQVRDILASFRLAGQFAKWMTAIVTAVTVMWATIKGVRT